jgi:alpha-methylacyl-CoA racemase
MLVVRSRNVRDHAGATVIGPLKGIKVIELAGVGSTPFAGMMLADMGADVLRIDREASNAAGVRDAARADFLGRSRRSVAVDLKHAAGVDALLALVAQADALIEGFRPGVMERLGLGPETCLERNPRLVYGRLTGWGQKGPLSGAAGHDINFIALAGALEPIGRRGQAPVPPLNLVGDFGGGGLLLAFGVVCALLERERSGRGQVVDAAMVDGAALLTTLIHELRHMGLWHDERGTNLLDTGAHFYDVYETADGRWIAVGAIEPKFYAELVQTLDLEVELLPAQMNRAEWPKRKKQLAAVFKTKTRDEWCALLEGTDACFSPVLSLAEAPEHRHNKARDTFVGLDGTVQPAPAPRYSRTPPSAPRSPPTRGQHTDEALMAWGFEADEIAMLRKAKAIF